MDEKVEETMGAIVDIKISMNCGETNVDATTNAKRDTNLDEKGGKLGLKKGCKHGPNMGTIVHTKL